MLFLTGKALSEHHQYPHGEYIDESILQHIPPPVLFKQREGCVCVTVNAGRRLSTSYYVGADWLTPMHAVFVEPKLNTRDRKTNYLQMLISCMGLPGIEKELDRLVEIKFDSAPVLLDQSQDLLTPLLLIRFLTVVKSIVRKGLRQSYYRVERNLNGKVKGKVLVTTTIKQNRLKNKPLYTICSYDEFGYNGLENRLIKKTLGFINSYLAGAGKAVIKSAVEKDFSYILNAFSAVSDEVEVEQVKHYKFNAFYSEYAEASRLAKMILKRFGFNISATHQLKIATPPFWVDMSLLFELYVLSMLRERFNERGAVKYHFSTYGNELDFLLNSGSYKMVVDAKYKSRYKEGVLHDDVRQVAGYARLKKVYQELGVQSRSVIDCLIIYPDQDEGHDILGHVDLTSRPMEGYENVYKLPVRIPEV